MQRGAARAGDEGEGGAEEAWDSFEDMAYIMAEVVCLGRPPAYELE